MLSDSIATTLAAVEAKLAAGEPISRIEVQIIASLMECWRDQARELETNGRPARVPASLIVASDNVISITTANFRGRKS